jgi:lipooligosaccharide transport system permease protein
MASPGPLLVVEREARAFRRLWHGLVFSSLVLPLLFLTAMGLGLGGLVDQHSGGVGGLSYLHFVAPGLVAAAAMQGAAANGLWGVMTGMRYVRYYHGMVASPLAASTVQQGYVLWTGLRAGVQSAIFLVVAGALGAVPSPWGVLAVPASVLTAMVFAAVLTAFAATQENDLAFPVIMRLGIMPLFLFSGTFFPIDQLPGWLRRVSVLSPLWHGVELCRAATTGSVDWAAAAGHVAVLVGLVAAGLAFGARTYTKALTP